MIDIVLYPNPILKQKAAPIEKIDDELIQLSKDMIEAMHKANGVGLAGPQVGVSKQIIVVNPTSEEGKDITYINPKIISKKGRCSGEEGCLSFPGIYGNVLRYEKITVTAQLLSGEEITWEANDFEARVLQHEIDHLHGMVFVNKVEASEQTRVQREVRAMEMEEK